MPVVYHKRQKHDVVPRDWSELWQDTPKGILHAHQASLPALPVPDLPDTLRRYLTSLEPLLTPEQLAHTTALCAAILADTTRTAHPVHRLHAALRHYADTLPGNKSWLIDGWNRVAYFAYREPLPFYVNYYFQFADTSQDAVRLGLQRHGLALDTQVDRAAAILRGCMAFRDLVLTETLEPEKGKDGPLCSHQYRFLFHACRVPRPTTDTTLIYPANPATTHAVVAHKGAFWKVPLQDSETGETLPTARLRQALTHILDIGATPADDLAVGALTTAHRDAWYKAREDLIAVCPENADSLQTIESAVCLLALDETSPVTREEGGRALWHGDGKNRWFDKALQFIVFANGKAGFNGEHSCMDATPTTRLCDYILSGIEKGTLDHGAKDVPDSLPLPLMPTPLTFRHSPKTYTAIQTAYASFAGHVAAHEMSVLAFSAYGKNFIKTVAKCSPDAYVQTALQHAYFLTRPGCVPCTYESSGTRGFFQGRTEATRSATPESRHFSILMTDLETTPAARLDALRRAIRAHSAYMASATKGMGVDRHLLGLRLIAQEKSLHTPDTLPDLFKDPAYARSSYHDLSTSQIYSAHFENWGWGEVVPDGFGCAYLIKPDEFNFQLTSKHQGSARFTYNLQKTLLEMRALFLSEAPKSKL